MAKTINIDVAADTYTEFNHPSTNYGSEDKLIISNDSDEFLACTYVKFAQLSSPDKSEPVTIDSANFIFRPNSNTTPKVPWPFFSLAFILMLISGYLAWRIWRQQRQ